MNNTDAKAKRPSMGRSRKGCMKGKGGPENALCTYKGVRQRTWGKWVAEIREPTGGTRIWLGTFDTSLDAAKVYDQASLKLYGPSADLNLASSCHMPTPINALLSTGIESSIQQEASTGNQEVGTISTPSRRSLTLADSMVPNESFVRGVDNMSGFWESSSSGLVGRGQSVYWPDLPAENDKWGINYDAGVQAGGLMDGESLCWDGFHDPWGF